jgi:hypothetical protein
MIDRRFFLKLTGFAAAASAFNALPVAAATQGPLTNAPATPDGLLAPGTYQFTGRVTLHEPVVQVGGITNAQQISWSGSGSTSAGFTSFEYFDRPWRMPEVSVRGGQLQSLAVVPVELG